VQAGTYTLGSDCQIAVDGSDVAVTANGLATYFPVGGDRVIVDTVNQQIELVGVPSVNKWESTPGGPDRVEIINGTDRIDFYNDGALVGFVTAKSVSITARLMQFLTNNGWGLTVDDVSGYCLLSGGSAGAGIWFDPSVTTPQGVGFHFQGLYIDDSVSPIYLGAGTVNGVRSLSIAATTGSQPPVGINPVSGTMVINTSARRFKKNITPLDLTSRPSLIDGLSSVTYEDLKDETNVPHLGYIAEDVEALSGWDELVFRGENGETMSLAYDRIVVGVVAELKQRLAVQEARNQAMEARLAALEAKVGV
jgi:hypothetical protein